MFDEGQVLMTTKTVFFLTTEFPLQSRTQEVTGTFAVHRLVRKQRAARGLMDFFKNDRPTI